MYIVFYHNKFLNLKHKKHAYHISSGVKRYIYRLRGWFLNEMESKCSSKWEKESIKLSKTMVDGEGGDSETDFHHTKILPSGTHYACFLFTTTSLMTLLFSLIFPLIYISFLIFNSFLYSYLFLFSRYNL